MKNILGLIFTKKGKEECMELVGKDFVVRTLDKNISDEMNAQQAEIEALHKGTELPAWFRISQMLSMVLCIILLFVYSKNQAEQWSVVLLIASVVIVVAFAVASVIGKRRERLKSSQMGAQAEKIIPKMNTTYKRAKRNMQIPDLAKEVDVFTQKYIVAENGELRDKSLIVADYASLMEFVWTSGDHFYISGIDMALAIPISDIKQIRVVEKTARFMGWNKRKQYNAPEYKQYAIKRNKYDVYSMRCYCELVIESGKCSGVIKFPLYELEVFKKLLHLEVSAQKDKNTDKIEK